MKRGWLFLLGALVLGSVSLRAEYDEEEGFLEPSDTVVEEEGEPRGSRPPRRRRPPAPRRDSNRFDAATYEYSIGFDSTSSTLGVWGQNAAVFGIWGESWGIEFIGGWTTGSDSASTSVATATTVVGGTNQTITTTHSGSRNPHAITLATVVKHKIFANKWLQVYGGLLMGANLFLSRSRPTGTETITVANTADPDDYSVSQVNLGTVTTSQSVQFLAGPKLGAEVFLKWFPHVAIGFSTAVVAKLGGKSTTLTETASKTFSVVNGVAQAPSSHSTSVTEAESDPGLSGATFGLGGTSFQFTGVFTIRYVW